jgi:hypothetical protein
MNAAKSLLTAYFLLAASAIAQSPAPNAKIITFNRADTEHCKVVVSNGKPLLESTYNGTTVAITMPQNWGNGEFSVFLAVAQVGAGEVQVDPKEITAVYPDPGHTAFRWFDKAHDLSTQASILSSGLGPPSAGPLGDSSSTSPLPNHPEAMPAPTTTVGTGSGDVAHPPQLSNDQKNAAALPKLDPLHPPPFLKRATVKQGSTVTGYVFLRKPKGSKLDVPPNGMVDEIDIPINGVIFRF